jgi:prevent-host-death family protein
MNLFDTKNRLSEVCDRVLTTGEPVVVTRRGKAIVQIVPLPEKSTHESVWSTVAESRAKYGKLKDDFDLPERTLESNRADPLT